MNFSAVLGLLAAVGITAFAVLDSTKNPKIFADIHGIVIVVGGTITVALLSFSFGRLKNAFKIIFRKMMSKESDNFIDTIKLIVKLSEVYRVNPKDISNHIPTGAHPFLKDAVQLITEYGFSPDDLDDVLTNAMKGKIKRDDDEIKVWHTISRFPPAFGLLGATLGMISLLQTLGDPGAQSRIGPAMATALIATFYGLVVANLVLIPLSEKLVALSASDKVMRQIIKDGILMVVDKRHPAYIEEFLKSFLAPSLRNAGAKPVVNIEEKQGVVRAA